MTAPPFYKKINRLVFLILGLWISHNLSAQKPYYYPPDKYIKNNKSSLQAVLQEADFQKGDLIVDIGAGNGWFDLALSDQTDSLTFYLEEIDSLKINPEKLENDIQKFSEVIGKSITNTFIQTLGNEKSTGLDTEFFDHALLIDTYHHFSYSEAMISDIHRILKPEARLLVYELIARKPKDLRPGCNSVLFSQEDIIKSFQSNGFTLRKAHKTAKHRSWQTRLFVFEK